MVKTTVAVYLIFYKLIFFESLIMFLEPTIKLITGIFDLQSNNNSYHDGTSAFVRYFFEKDPHLNAFDYILGFIFYAVSRTKTDLRNKYMI